MSDKQLKITQVRSPIGYEKSQGAALKALGLRKMHASVVKTDSPTVRGLIFKVQHLITVEEVSQS